MFIDESGAHLARGRSHAWVLRGEVVVDPRPMNWGDNLTIIGTMRSDRWLTLSTDWRAANAERFVTSVERQLVPKMRDGDIVVMGTLSAHKNVRVPNASKRLARRSSSCHRIPTISPLESAWGLIKKRIRAVAPRSGELSDDA